QAADRYSRQALTQIAQGGLVLVGLALAALSQFAPASAVRGGLELPVPEWWQQAPVLLVFACLLLLGACRALYMPTRSALLFQVVPPEALPNAVTWNSSGWQVAQVAGPALAGLTLWGLGYAATYLLAACGFLSCIVLLAAVRPRPVAWQPQPPTLKS